MFGDELLVKLYDVKKEVAVLIENLVKRNEKITEAIVGRGELGGVLSIAEAKATRTDFQNKGCAISIARAKTILKKIETAIKLAEEG